MFVLANGDVGIYTCAIYTHRGCSYHVVHNGQQAVEEVTASMLNEGAVMYDVILMDCMMVREAFVAWVSRRGGGLRGLVCVCSR